MNTNLYIPMDVYPELLPRIKTADIPATMAKPTPELDMATLKCVLLSFEGVDMQVRTPFAFPFIMTVLRGEFRQPLHYLEDVDWLFLGGDTEMFVTILKSRCHLMNSTVTIIPFKSFINTIPGTPVEGEFHVTQPRQTENYNETAWSKNKEDFNNTPSENWKEVFKGNTTGFEGLIEEYAVPYLQREPKVIVDLGCGLGKTTHGLANMYPNAKVYGLELSDSALDVARKAFTAPNLEFIKHDISAPLPFEEGTIDLLLSINALAYAKNQRKSASNIFSKLSTDGIFFNHSRIGYSHDFWEYPNSLIWPVIFQIYPETWAEGAQDYGFSTRILPPKLSRPLTPWSFGHTMSPEVRDVLDECSQHLCKMDIQKYHPHLTHALMLHSKHVEDNMQTHVCGSPMRNNIHTHCFNLIEEMPTFIQETARMTHKSNAEKMGLCPTGIEYCERITGFSI